MAQATLLVIEDEETLARSIAYSLGREGFRVVVEADGLKGLETARSTKPDLVVLDVMLPSMDGFQILRQLRRDGTTPVLMLTAKIDDVDKIVGLDLGADDYMTKPFSMRELLARINALLRRVEMDKGPAQPEATTLHANGLSVDIQGRRVALAGKSISLRPKEFDLLVFLMHHPGQVFSRDALLEKVWGYDYAGGSRTVDVHVRWLREKIESDASNPLYLSTVRGVGYRFET